MVEQITIRWEANDHGGGGTGSFLAYAFRRNELYMSGTKIFGDENKNGFYKVSYEGLSPDEWQWEKLFGAQENNGYNFEKIYTLFVAPDNSIWGNNEHLARIINNNGQSDFYQITLPTDLYANPSRPIKSSASHLYFSAKHNNHTGEYIHRVSYSNPTSAENVFSDITLNTKNISILNFDIGGDYLYFNAVENPYVVDNTTMGDFFTGKINLTTLEYTELEFSWKITAIVVY
jgi:hypothetical protein